MDHPLGRTINKSDCAAFARSGILMVWPRNLNQRIRMGHMRNDCELLLVFSKRILIFFLTFVNLISA